MFRVNIRNTRATSISSAFTVNFEHISIFSSVSIVELEQVNVSWDGSNCKH